MQPTVLVIDVGSTRLKAALYNPQGLASAPYSADSPLQAPSVQADAVLQAVVTAASQVCAGMRPDAIAITGATRTHVLTAADGRALGHLVKLDDPRGAEFEDAIRTAYGEPQGRGMGAFHPFARLLHCQATQAERYAQTRWQLELKDWLNLQLTGISRTDEVAQARLQPLHGTPGDVLQRLGLRAGLCPPSMAPGRVLGPLASTHAQLAPLAGIAVVQCGFDAWCASYGMGCVKDGHVYNVTGTTEVFGSFSTRRQALPGVSCLEWAPGLHHLGGPCLTGLGTLAWFGRSFLNDGNPQTVMDCAGRAQADSPLCLPFVSGERMPFWRADLSAQFLDVRSQHGLPEMARALVDGLMVFQRYLIALLCPQASAIHLSGGAAALAGWAELKAGAFGIPAKKCTAAEPALLGAAISALTAIGQFKSLEEAQAAMAPAAITVDPDPAETRRIAALEKRLRPYLLAIADAPTCETMAANMPKPGAPASPRQCAF